MEQLWSADHPLCTQEVRERLRPTTRMLAYTTVMTVLDRLYDKGWLRRWKEGRAFRYSPAITRVDLAVRQMNQALATDEDRAEILSRFVERLPPEERRLLAGLASPHELPPNRSEPSRLGATA